MCSDSNNSNATVISVVVAMTTTIAHLQHMFLFQLICNFSCANSDFLLSPLVLILLFLFQMVKLHTYTNLCSTAASYQLYDEHSPSKAKIVFSGDRVLTHHISHHMYNLN